MCTPSPTRTSTRMRTVTARASSPDDDVHSLAATPILTILVMDDISEHVCGILSVRDLASVRMTCVAGRQSSSGWPILSHFRRADAPLPAVWRSPAAHQVIAAVDGHGAAMDRAIQWCVSSKTSSVLLALSTATRDEDGSTCIHRLLGPKTHQLLYDALRCGANSGAQDKEGHAPLHTAASLGDQCAARVLAIAGADVNQRDRNGDAPIHYSAELGDKATMRILLQAGADWTLKCREGFTPMQLARGHSTDCLNLIMRARYAGKLKPPTWCIM